MNVHPHTQFLLVAFQKITENKCLNFSEHCIIHLTVCHVEYILRSVQFYTLFAFIVITDFILLGVLKLKIKVKHLSVLPEAHVIFLKWTWVIYHFWLIWLPWLVASSIQISCSVSHHLDTASICPVTVHISIRRPCAESRDFGFSLSSSTPSLRDSRQSTSHMSQPSCL